MNFQQRKDIERQQRVDLIISSAEKLFFSKGFDLITMDYIAKEAGFTKKTVYSYFASKDDLYYEIMLRGFSALNSLLDKALEKNSLDELSKLRLIGTTLVEFFKANRGYFTAINYFNTKDIGNIEGNPIAQKCYKAGQYSVEIISDIIKCGIKNGTIDPEIDVNKTVLTLWASLIGIINLIEKKSDYIREYFDTDILDTVEYGFDLIIKSMKGAGK